MFKRLIHARERHLSQRDKNRVVRPFEWGTSYITGEPVNGDDPRQLFRQHTERVMNRSEDFYPLPLIKDYQLTGQHLSWTSAVQTPSPENNIVRAHFFPAPSRRRESNRNGHALRQDAPHLDKEHLDEGHRVEEHRPAVLLLPQWNAQPESHMSLCRVLNRLGISALRLTLPYHEARRPPELERADYLFSSNVGRTLQSMRQAVLDTRAAVSWLIEHGGYNRIGIMGTSIGSCTAFLAYAHDERIDMGVFNLVSGYVADVAWRGISTQHVRAGFGDAISLEELREYWLPISPFPFIKRLLKIRERPMRFIIARHDLTFPEDLTRDVIEETQRLGLPLDVSRLPSGHYTSGEKPWVYLDGWKIASFFKKHL